MRSEASQRRLNALALRRILASDAPSPIRSARARIFVYSTQACDRALGSRTAPVDEGPLFGFTLDESARTLLQSVQAELRMEPLGVELEVGRAFSLFADRSWSLRALRFRYGVREAKAIEMQITENAPLTICMGRPAYVTSPRGYPVKLGRQLAHSLGPTEIGIPLYGCFRVFADSRNTGRGRKWCTWCPECLPSQAQRSRSAARKHLVTLGSISESRSH